MSDYQKVVEELKEYRNEATELFYKNKIQKEKIDNLQHKIEKMEQELTEYKYLLSVKLERELI